MRLTLTYARRGGMMEGREIWREGDEGGAGEARRQKGDCKLLNRSVAALPPSQSCTQIFYLLAGVSVEYPGLLPPRTRDEDA
jgi:hypothetical protein